MAIKRKGTNGVDFPVWHTRTSYVGADGGNQGFLDRPIVKAATVGLALYGLYVIIKNVK